MKIKILRAIRFDKNKSMPPGTVCEARRLFTMPFQLNAPYQIIEGPLCGVKVPIEECIEIEEEKLYTEKEWNELKDQYTVQLKKEREQTAIFQGLARDLTDKVKDKNKEIEKLTFFVECSNLALRASCQAIETLKGKNN